MCQFLLGKVQQKIALTVNKLLKMCQFLLGKVQQNVSC